MTTTHYDEIAKDEASLAKPPNIGDYESTYASWSWDDIRA